MPAGLSIDDPAILDFTDLRDSAGNEVAPFDDDAVAIAKERRTTVAARLAAIYHDVDDVDAFTGMLAERHAPGAELGELQLAMWQKQFTALRDGDRFFYGNDPVLARIAANYGIDYRHTLAQIIEANTDIAPGALNPTGNVFLTPDAVLPPTTCAVSYTAAATGPHTFRADVAVTNTGTDAVSGWVLRFDLANGQTIQGSARSLVAQRGPFGRYVTMMAGLLTWRIPPGATVARLSFSGTFDGTANAAPPNVTLNQHRCAVA
jgi:hypothetical protein